MARTEERAIEDLGFTTSERAVLQDFLEAWPEHGQPVLFVGAGMSKNAVPRQTTSEATRFKDWSELIDGLRGELMDGSSSATDRLPKDLLRLAQLYEVQFGRSRLIDAVERATPAADFDPGPAHWQLVGFPWAAVITTNYDDLLERAFARRKPVVKVVWDPDLTRRRALNSLLLLKMHGDLADRESIVLTEDDYRCYEPRRAGIRLKVTQLLLEHPCLFVGFSLSDPNVAHIDGWIRDAMGSLKLPSISLLRAPRLEAERDMWSRRGIHLVCVPQGQELRDVFAALHEERDRRNKRRPTAPPPAQATRLAHLLRSTPEGWQVEAATLAGQLADMPGKEAYASLQELMLGGHGALKVAQVESVLGEMGPTARRKMLLRANAAGLPWVMGADGKLLEIEAALLKDHELSVRERAEVTMRRAIRLERAGKPEEAKLTLLSLLDGQGLDEKATEEIQLGLRRILLSIGDEAEIDKYLLSAPVKEDAFSYARRGADALVARGRDAARPWYEKASDLARTGDERHAAFMGLWATCEPGDWSSMAVLNEKSRAIPDDEMPRVMALRELAREAGDSVLRERSVCGSTSHGTTEAIGKLRSALQEADEMGWPRSPKADVTTPADGLAGQLVGLLVREGGSPEDLKEGVVAFVERGLLSAKRLAVQANLERVLAGPGGLEWLRGLLRRERSAVFMRRSAAVLRSAFLSALPDEEITEHVRAHFRPMRALESEDPDRGLMGEHLEMIAARLFLAPKEAARCALEVATGRLLEGPFGHPQERPLLELPLARWLLTGALEGNEGGVDALLDAIVHALAITGNRDDWFARRPLLELIGSAAEAGLVKGKRARALESALDGWLGALEPIDDDSSAFLEIGTVRAGLPGKWRPEPRLVAAFVRSYKWLRNSSSCGFWSNGLEYFGQFLSDADRETVAESVRDHVDYVLAGGGNLLGPNPEWAATSVHMAVKHRLLEGDEGGELLARLVESYPECSPWVVGLDGIPIETESSARRAMLRAELVGQDEGRTLQRWACWATDRRFIDSDVERALLGQRFSTSSVARARALHALAKLAAGIGLAEEGLAEFSGCLPGAGREDPSYLVRAAAIGATRTGFHVLPRPLVFTMLEESGDDVAHVRRERDALRRVATAGGGATQAGTDSVVSGAAKSTPSATRRRRAAPVKKPRPTPARKVGAEKNAASRQRSVNRSEAGDRQAAQAGTSTKKTSRAK